MPPATIGQIKYIECLFIDLGYGRKLRNSWLSRKFDRTILFVDELNRQEADLVIKELIELKNVKTNTSESE